LIQKVLKNNNKIDYKFKNQELFRLALSHRSAGKDNNERLEFMGDSILGFIIADTLYQRFPEASEGELSRLRAGLVQKSTLADVAKELELGEILILGGGELKSGGSRRESILADALEALISAVYIDAGMEVCRAKILQWFASRLDALEQAGSLPDKDSKTRLQEFLQAKKLDLPSYELKEIHGKEHQQSFIVNCHIPLLKEPVCGEGNSRRDAEQAAAERALKLLKL